MSCVPGASDGSPLPAELVSSVLMLMPGESLLEPRCELPLAFCEDFLLLACFGTYGREPAGTAGTAGTLAATAARAERAARTAEGAEGARWAEAAPLLEAAGT